MRTISKCPIKKETIAIPRKYDGARGLEARAWIRHYRLCCESNDWKPQQTIKRMGTYMEKSALAWYMRHISGHEELTTLDQIEELFNENFIDYDYMAKLKSLLENRRPKTNEPATSFINDMEFHLYDAYPELDGSNGVPNTEGEKKVVWKILERMLPDLQNAIATQEP